jgi:DNA repair photolyase
MQPSSPHRGRGVFSNPKNRFESVQRECETDPEAEVPTPSTRFLTDNAKSIIATNDSPDVGFDAGINPYRGCEHGCVYCYARPTHEYLGFSSGLDFETRIMVKERAPELLREAMENRRWTPQVLALSGVTDPFQPVERKLQLTRRCLGVLAEFRNPVVIITKNFLVTRDIDHLSELARHDAAAVLISITTLDPDLCGVMEPRTSRPSKRLEAIRRLTDAGVPAGVNVAPVIPGLTDEEIPSIVSAAARAGARFAGMTPLRLPYAVKSLFEDWLEAHLPERKNKILHRIEAIRGGRLNDPNFGSRMEGEGIFAEQMAGLFDLACRKAGISGGAPHLSTDHFKRPAGPQMDLF